MNRISFACGLGAFLSLGLMINGCTKENGGGKPSGGTGTGTASGTGTGTASGTGTGTASATGAGRDAATTDTGTGTGTATGPGTGVDGSAPLDGGLGSGLVAYWPFDEANPDDVCKDTSGNGYDATPEASPPRGEGKFGAHGLNLNPTVSAIDPTHDQYVGCTQKVNVAATMPPPAGSFSISVWIRPKDIAARQYIVAYTGVTEMALFVEKTRELRYWRWDPKPLGSTKHPSEGVSSKLLTPGVWTHVVVTVGPAVPLGSAEPNHRLYVNGNLAGTYAGGVGSFTTGTWHIGAKGSLQFCFSGDIDEVRLYGQVLTPTEVQNLFSNNAL